MQCKNCQTEVVSGMFACPQCGLPVQTSAVAPPDKQPPSLRKDISWLVWGLLCAPCLLLSIAEVWKGSVDIAKMEGQALAPGIMAAGVAWLLGRFGKFRFRLTMVVAYAVLVGLSLIGLLTPEAAAADSPSAQQSGYEVQWSAGWQVHKQPIPPESELRGEVIRATKMESGRTVATITLTVFKSEPGVSLLGEMQSFVGSAQNTAEKAGYEWSSSQPAAGRMKGNPSLEVETHLKRANVTVRQWFVMTASDRQVCVMDFAAQDANYERTQGDFRQVRDSLICY
ncbi:DUF4946 domain-containing protein [Dyella flagellata]|uniref:Zinc ribbon domain-containing protein n=1 Tax=Dyella flagellata TaxID=1867833 RepID=A0ABQ5XF00_9GAMM|nr:DUF4946 domain-containing protein [Dyella flagellata]GLQ90260.1 hypothetical protein GCM10007898_38350 [Dyella flagellata]